MTIKGQAFTVKKQIFKRKLSVCIGLLAIGSKPTLLIEPAIGADEVRPTL